MNATGDSDTRNYYDRVTTEQKIEIQPLLSPLDTLLQISALGTAPDGLFYNWNPLWQMDEAEGRYRSQAGDRHVGRRCSGPDGSHGAAEGA
jgi:hypothetical protein